MPDDEKLPITFDDQELAEELTDAEISHIVAGSVEVVYAVVTGAAGFGFVATRFLVPVLLGNLLGGAMLVGALHHAQIEADKGHA